MLCTAAVCVLSGGSAYAQEWTWVGNGVNSLWNTPANWSPASVPPNSNLSAVLFGTGFASGSPNMNGDRLINTLTIDTGASFTLQGAANTLTVSGSGIVKLPSSSGTQTLNTTVLIGDTGFWNIHGGGAVIVSRVGETGGTRALTKGGGGILILGTGSADTSANTYGGLTTASNGTLVLNKAANTAAIPANLLINGGNAVLARSSQIPDGSAVTINSGALRLAGASETFASLSGSGGVVDLGGGALQLNQNVSTTYSGAIVGGGTFTKAGSASLTLNGTGNSFENINVPSGSLTFSGGSSSFIGDITVAAGAAFRVQGGAMVIGDNSTNFSFGILNGTGFNSAFGFVDGAGSRWDVGAGLVVGDTGRAQLQITNGGRVDVHSMFVGNQAGGGGNVSLFTGGQLMAEAVVVAGDPASSGDIFVNNAGSHFQINQHISLGGFNKFSPGGDAQLQLVGSSATVGGSTNFFSPTALISVINGTFTTGQLNSSIGGRVELADPFLGTALTVGTNHQSSTFNGLISNFGVGGSGGSLDKVGTSTLTLLNNANSFSGAVRVLNGTLSTPSVSDIGSPSAIGAGSLLVLGQGSNSGQLHFSGPGGSTNRTLQSVNGQINVSNPNATLVFTAPLTGSNLTKVGPGAVAFTGGGAIDGLAIANNGGAVRLNGGSMSASIQTSLSPGSLLEINNASLITGKLSGTGGVIRLDDGAGPALTLTGPDTSTFAGNITDGAGGAGSILKTGPGDSTLSGILSYTGTTTINAGILRITQGLPTPGGAVTINGGLAASGIVQRPIAGNGELSAPDNLMIGSPGDLTGFAFDGQLNVVGSHVHLMDANQASLGVTTIIELGARLSSSNGILLSLGRNLVALDGATVDGEFTNNGDVGGPFSFGQFLRFNGPVDGAGGYSGHVAFLNHFTPDAGNAKELNITGRLLLDHTSAVHMDLGGEIPGTEHDQINLNSEALLAGTMVMHLINGFVALPGDMFEVMTFGSRSGDIAIANETGFAGLGFNKIYTSTSLTLLATGTGGDANLDGRVNLSDFNILAGNFGQTGANWLQADFTGDGRVNLADFNVLAGNFGFVAQGPEVLPEDWSTLAAVVPEPRAMLFVGAAICVMFGGRQRQRRVS